MATALSKDIRAMMHRAYSLLEIKQVKDDQRIIVGTATTPTPDRLGDIVEPLGVKFKNPLPLLWHHLSSQPVGTVKFSKPTKDGIDFEARLPKIDEPGPLKDRVDTAWGEVKHGLVRGVSIGFRELEFSRLDDGGLRFIESEVLELSLVTIPANAEATIQIVKSLDSEALAASGRERNGVDPNPAGVPAKRKSVVTLEGKMPTAIAEQISAFEASRAAKFARMEAIQQKAAEEKRSKDEGERDEFDTLSSEVDTIDKELADLRVLEKKKAAEAKPIVVPKDPEEGSKQRGGEVIVRTQPKLGPGIGFARVAKCIALAAKEYRNPADIAEALYGPDSIVVGALKQTRGDVVAQLKAAVAAGTTISGNWLANLVGTETGVVADFAEFLRPRTIVGRFGTNGIPGFREVPFRTPLVTQTGGGEGYWVGQGNAKPLTSFAFARTTMEPLKVANICVLTEESIRDTSPKADVIIRDALVDALRARLDRDFIDPANAGTANIKPASITNAAINVVSAGTDADDVRLDIKTLLNVFDLNDNPPEDGVWIMSSTNANSLSMMVNQLGQPEFPTVSMTGGTLKGMPIIASRYAGSTVILVNASDIFFADDGEASVDMSREASLEMSDAPGHDSDTPTPAQLVSMFQTNSVALRAERTLNWKLRRSSAVVYLTGVVWGGEVPTG